MTQHRLTLDAAVSYSGGDGYGRSVHCADFRGADVDSFHAYQEPTTKLAMLRPSILDPNYHAGFRGLSQWTYNPDFWQHSARGQNPGGSPDAMTSVQPADKAPTLIETLVTTAIIAIEAAVLEYDDLKWALTSQFTVPKDAGFALHYHGITDEFLRKNNWYFIRWADIGIHISQTGVAGVYQYPRNSDGSVNHTAPPKFKEEFVFGQPGDLLGKGGYFWLQPIRDYGILFTHSHLSQKSILASNADARTTQGHVIKWPTRNSPAATAYVTEESLVDIAVNPYQPHLMAFQDVTFAASGTYTDSLFDTIDPMSTAPAILAPTYLLPAALAADPTPATAALRKADNSAAWPVGDLQARVQISLATSNMRYTPFVNGYVVAWSPTMIARGTTPTEPSKLIALEYTEDEYKRFEGKATVHMETAAQRKIVERGDTTWTLERRQTDDDEWELITGGLALITEAEAVIDSGGFRYEAEVSFWDNWERCRESFDMNDRAFDNSTLIEAYNGALLHDGFGPLLSYPSDLPAIRIPAGSPGQTWQIAPREGDSSERLLQTFLLFCRRQHVEYRLYYDWAVGRWRIDKKPRDEGEGATWTLTAYSDEHDPAARSVRYETLKINPEPPEANTVYVYGVSSNEAGKAERVKTPPATNPASLTDPTSDDYLGRRKIAGYKAVGVTDLVELNKMGRRICAAVSHRRLKSIVETPDDIPGLIPNTRVHVRAQDPDGVRSTLWTAWVKRRTYAADQDGQEKVTYALDTVWEGEMDQ